MFNPKSEQCTTSVTPELSPHNQPFVQAESELIEVQLEALAQGLMKLTTFYTSCNVNHSSSCCYFTSYCTDGDYQ